VVALSLMMPNVRVLPRRIRSGSELKASVNNALLGRTITAFI
jgi:hypothetical protein